MAKEKEKKDELKLTDLPGIGQTTATKLEEAGYGDLMSVAVMTPSDLSSVADLSENSCEKGNSRGKKNVASRV